MKQEEMTLYHNDSSIKTLQEFMERSHIKNTITVDELFDYNRQLIFNQTSFVYRINNKIKSASDLTSSSTLPCPCILKIPSKYVTFVLSISQTNWEQQTDDIYAFENENITNITQDEGYISESKIAKKQNPTCSVWGWFKSLYYAGVLEGKDADKSIHRSQNNGFTDVSQYVINLTTNVSESGGSFSITFPIINSIEQLANIKVASDNNSKNLYYVDRTAKQIDVFNYAEKYYFHKAGMVSAERNYFNWLCQSNDLLFIAFEKLDMENRKGVKIFDMIGLIDSVVVSYDANAKGTVTVSGRDLMKLLRDDSSLFFNNSTIWGASQIFTNTESMGKQGDIASNAGSEATPIQRLRYTSGNIDIFQNPFNRNLDFIMKGVVSQLANIEIVPDNTFVGWGDRRTRWADIVPNDNAKGGSSGNGNGNGGGNGTANPFYNATWFQNNQNSPNMSTMAEKEAALSGMGGASSLGGDVPSIPRESRTIISDRELGIITIK